MSYYLHNPTGSDISLDGEITVDVGSDVAVAGTTYDLTASGNSARSIHDSAALAARLAAGELELYYTGPGTSTTVPAREDLRSYRYDPKLPQPLTNEREVSNLSSLAISQLLVWGHMPAEIRSGYQGVYASVEAATAALTAATVWPRFAVVDEDPAILMRQFAEGYTIEEVAGRWEVPSPPAPEGGSWVVAPVENLGDGNNAWTYWFGIEVKVKVEAVDKAIVAFAASLNGTAVHNWALYKSSSTGSAAPKTKTYSLQETGTVTADDGRWVTARPAAPIPVSADEWWAFVVWVGEGGKRARISDLRGSGYTDETLVRINGAIGYYDRKGSGTPGPDAPPKPTWRNASWAYGLVSLAIGDAP